MSQYKKRLLSISVVMLSGLSGFCFTMYGDEAGMDAIAMPMSSETEMGILPIFDESGRIIDTPTGRLELVRALRPQWRQSHAEPGKKGDWKAHESPPQRGKKSPEEMQEKLKMKKEQFAALGNEAIIKKVEDINNMNLRDHLKWRKLNHLGRLINDEFDKLDYVKYPGKFNPAEISAQEDMAFDEALKHMHNAKEGVRKFGDRRHGDRQSYHKRKEWRGERPVEPIMGGCTSCGVK